MMKLPTYLPAIVTTSLFISRCAAINILATDARSRYTPITVNVIPAVDGQSEITVPLIHFNDPVPGGNGGSGRGISSSDEEFLQSQNFAYGTVNFSTAHNVRKAWFTGGPADSSMKVCILSKFPFDDDGSPPIFFDDEERLLAEIQAGRMSRPFTERKSASLNGAVSVFCVAVF